MARNKTPDSDDDGQGAAPADKRSRAARRSGAPAPAGAPATGRARPGPQSRSAKAGSVTKSVQQGRSSRFLREVIAELKKVTWPTRPQLLQATAVVIVAVAIVAAFLGLADQVSEWIVDRIF